MRWKKVMKDNIMARTRSTSDLPSSNNGDLGQRIDARLHDLSQLQLENGKRTHVSRANISKSNSSNVGNRSYHSDHGPNREHSNNRKMKTNVCPLHPNIDPQSFESQALSVSTSNNYCSCEEDGCRSLIRTRSSPPTSSECTNTSSNPNVEPYFFDRRWRACKCANITNRSYSGIEINENLSGKLSHIALDQQSSVAHRRGHYRGDFNLKSSHYPSQYYPDLSPMEMCYLLQGDHPDQNQRLEMDDASHIVNTLTIRDVQLLLLQENHMNVPRNRSTLAISDDQQSPKRRWQDKLTNNIITSENCRVSEERLSRIANWHHLPRVSVDRAKLMRSVSNDHIPVPLGNALHWSHANIRHTRKNIRGISSRLVKRSESVQHESYVASNSKSTSFKMNNTKNSISAKNLGNYSPGSNDNMHCIKAKNGRTFLAHNKKVTNQLCSKKYSKETNEILKDIEVDTTLSSENNSGETDLYEDSSTTISLPDSIEGDGPSYSTNFKKGGLVPKTLTTGHTKSDSIEEEDERAIGLMREEDLSFQLLQDADTVHKYVASRGQREKEEDIYEVFPPTITIKHRSTRIIRHR